MNRGKSWTIWNISEETRMKAKLLCAGKSLSLGQLVEELIAKEWNQGKTPATKEFRRKAKRLLRKYEGVLE